MSIKTYEQLMQNVSIDNAVAEAEAEYDQNGELLDAKETLSNLRRKHFG